MAEITTRQNVRILLYNPTGNTSYSEPVYPNGQYLDLLPDEQISIIYNISTVKDISQKKTSKSKTFSLPGTSTNNKVLGWIFQINAQASFNPSKKCNATIFVDDLPVFKGYFLLDGINRQALASQNAANSPVYSCLIYEEVEDLFSQIKDKYLEDLDLSAHDHDWSAANITEN